MRVVDTGPGIHEIHARHQHLHLIEYEDAAPEVRAVCDDIMNTRRVDWINNFRKVLANHPETLARVWNDVKLAEAVYFRDLLPWSRSVLAVRVPCNDGR